jgi:DNA-binding transcriptional regulator YbjK
VSNAVARPSRQTERRADLVQAALDAVSERGLRALSLADVAEQAGLTRGAILYYYDDLDALLVEAHRAGIERFCDQRDRIVGAIDAPGTALAAAIREGLPSGPDDALMRLLYEFDVLAGSSSLHDDLVRRMYLRQVATYTRVLEAGTTSGAFHPTIPVDRLAMNLVALEDAYALHIVGGNDLITVATASQAMLEISERLGCPTR